MTSRTTLLLRGGHDGQSYIQTVLGQQQQQQQQNDLGRSRELLEEMSTNKEALPYATVELFPILFSIACLGAASLFTLFIAIRAINLRRKTRHGHHDQQGTHVTVTQKHDRSWTHHTKPRGDHSQPIESLDLCHLHRQGHDDDSWIGDDMESLILDPEHHLTSSSTKGMDGDIIDKSPDTSLTTSVTLEEFPEEKLGHTSDHKADTSGPSIHWEESSTKKRTKTDKKSKKKSKKKPKKPKKKKHDVDHHQAVLSWRGLECSYASKHPDAEPVVTLRGASGALYAQQLTAIMGPSGSGKSTLLDIIAGRKNLGVLHGEISIEGKVVTIGEAGGILKDVAAYVPQNETFFPTQTPEEAVMFFANLKLGRDGRGQAYRGHSISKLLDQIGLSQAARSRPIGGSLAGGLTIRGLSGGERKRLALACAVAMRPSIVFLDEITSGLDSENAIKMTRLIKRLCRRMGVAAAMVIHQPSDKIFKLFDQLILLANGRCAFSGPVTSIPEWYKTVIMKPMPSSHRLADDLLSRSTVWQGRACEDDIQELALLENTYPIQSRMSSSCHIQGASTSWKFACIFFRNLENHYIRNISNLAARILIYAMTAMLLGLVFWQVGDYDVESLDNAKAQIVMGAGLFLAEASILLPFAQIGTFFFDKKVFAAENALGLYEPWMYAISQFLLEAWAIIICSFVQAAIAIPMIALWNPVWLPVESFLTMLCFFCLGGLVGNSVILLISMISISQDVAFLCGAMYVTVGLACSGGFVPFASMQRWIRWLQWISAIKYSLQAFVQTSFDGTNVTIVEELELDRPDSITLNFVAQLGMFFIFAMSSVVFLSMQKERR